MKKGILVVISGPSGVGKNTIASKIVEQGYGIYSVSMTTRKRREGENEGSDYFFVTEEVFKSYILEDKFLEYAKYNNNYYGTLKDFVFHNLNNGTNVIAVLDIQGGMEIEKIFPQAVLVFIMPPSFEELERRLKKRNTDSEEDIIKRLAIAKEEIKYKEKYDYVVINSSFDKAINDIIEIIKKEKNK